MAPRAILLDLFDTLVDLYMDRLPIVEVAGRRIPSTLGALHAVARERVQLDLDGFAAALRASDAELYRSHHAQGLELPTLRRFGEFCGRIGVTDPRLPQLLTDVHMEELRSQVRILPHHRAILAQLRERVRLALVSNFSHSPLALRVLEEAGLREHLDEIVISDAVGVRKPRPEIFAAALERLELEPGEVVHVGDNLHADVRGAAQLGIASVWITRRVDDPAAALADHDGPTPTWTIHDLAELPALIEDRGAVETAPRISDS